MSAHAQPEIDQQALLQRARGGDPEAFYELVKPCERGVYAIAFSILENQSDAEDASQEAVLKAFKSIASFRGEAKFSTWLIQITINEARMKLRKQRRHLYQSLDEALSTQDGDPLPRELSDWREIPSSALEHRELREMLVRAMNSLPEIYRSVFILRDVQKLDIRETAKSLGITEASVKTRLLRARLQMREALAPGLGSAWTQPHQDIKVNSARRARQSLVQ
jgi:RNA polymerase sigma-70 factor (ECF subfamily)